eukprot:9672556-Prorocentrum_lima.AAC.1
MVKPTRNSPRVSVQGTIARWERHIPQCQLDPSPLAPPPLDHSLDDIGPRGGQSNPLAGAVGAAGGNS